MSHASRSPRTARMGYYDNKCSARSGLGNISNGSATAANLRKYRLRYVEPTTMDCAILFINTYILNLKHICTVEDTSGT